MGQLIFAFDTETGGLDPVKWDLLTFYGGLYDENFTLVEELEMKLKPNEGRIPNAEAGALKVNKIDIQKHFADPATITYAEGAVLLKTMLKKHLKKNGRYSNIRPMGYNVDFDIGYTQHYLLPKNEWDSILHYGKMDPKVVVDFLKDCQWLPRDVGNLESVVNFFGVPRRNAHNAKEDTVMMIDVYKKILELMASKKDGGGGGADLISLLEAE